MRTAITYGHSEGGECGILLPNHLSSGLDDSTGDRAEILSQAFDVPVLSYERDGTAGARRIPKYEDEQQYLADAERRAEILAGRMEAFGIKHLVVVGNSAGATEALAVASRGILDILQVIAMEPVATRPIDRKAGLAYYKSQREWDKSMLFDPEYDAIDPAENIRPKLGSIEEKLLISGELIRFDHVYRSGVSLECLRTLAIKFPEIPVDLVLGARSPAMDEATRQTIITEFADSSIKVDVLPMGKHSFADRIYYFLHIIEKAIINRDPPVLTQDLRSELLGPTGIPYERVQKAS
jgi:pimeloyl-ACP methyl ester carboxylesterase